MSDDVPKRDTRFGIGNPGRPKGARSKLGEAFLEALHQSFKDGGIDAVNKVRDEDPPAYCKIIASLLPKVLQGSDDPEAAPIAIAYRWAEASTAPKEPGETEG
jgi:hypothetical protein